MIEGIIVTELKTIEDERGKIMHMLRSDWDVFQSFGEIYFSCVYPKKIKGWKKHTAMVQNLACVSGSAKLVIYDDREGSPTKGMIETIEFGKDHYCLVTIHPGLWVGFTAIGNEMAVIGNCASMLHDPNESLSIPYDSERIPYKWEELIND